MRVCKTNHSLYKEMFKYKMRNSRLTLICFLINRFRKSIRYLQTLEFSIDAGQWKWKEQQEEIDF